MDKSKYLSLAGVIAAVFVVGGLAVTFQGAEGQTITVVDDGTTKVEQLEIKIEVTKETTTTLYQGTKNDLITQIEQIDREIERLMTEKTVLLDYLTDTEAELNKLPARALKALEI